MTIKVLLCDDQAVVTAGLRIILGAEKDIEVVGSAENGEQALKMASQLAVDVVLMDLKMPVMNGVEATRALRSLHPCIKILVLTTYDQDQWVFDAIRAGANGFLLKDTPPSALLSAIRDISAGKSPLDPAVAGVLMEQVANGRVDAPGGVEHDLTERELDVLRLLARGFTNPQISENLYLSQGTVRNIISAILLKLNVEDRTQAAVFAIRNGLAGG